MGLNLHHQRGMKTLAVAILLSSCNLSTEEAQEAHLDELRQDEFCSGEQPRAIVRGEVVALREAAFEEYGWSCCVGGAIRFVGSAGTEVFITIGVDTFGEDEVPSDLDLAEQIGWFLEGSLSEPDSPNALSFSDRQWTLRGHLKNRSPWSEDTEFCLWATPDGEAKAIAKLYLP